MLYIDIGEYQMFVQSIQVISSQWGDEEDETEEGEEEGWGEDEEELGFDE